MKKTSNEILIQSVIKWALDKKGEDVQLLDLTGVLDITDAFVVVTGFSEVQVQAIADWITDKSREAGFDFINVEGRDSGRWVLIDYVDVVVHVMLPEERERYRLDRLWSEAGLTEFDETGQARVVREKMLAEGTPEVEE